jgi:hypothetical protein
MAGCCGGRTKVTVEFDFLQVDDATCDRCDDSLAAVRSAVADASMLGVSVELVERTLDASRLADSNRVLVNGRPAEEWLGGSSSMSSCPSCAELTGADACCREIALPDGSSASYSRELVLDAIMIAAGLGGAPASKAPSRLSVMLVTGPGCG